MSVRNKMLETPPYSINKLVHQKMHLKQKYKKAPSQYALFKLRLVQKKLNCLKKRSQQLSQIKNIAISQTNIQQYGKGTPRSSR